MTLETNGNDSVTCRALRATVKVPKAVIDDVKITLYQWEGSLKTFDDRCEIGGFGDDHKRQQDLQKMLKEEQTCTKLEWDKYHVELCRQGDVQTDDDLKFGKLQ